jgi:TldD protein
MRTLAALLLDHLAHHRVDYGDVRVVHRTTEEITVRNGQPEVITGGESYGFGVRVLVGGCWGFAAASDLSTDRLEETVHRAILTAKAAGLVHDCDDPFEPPAPVTASYVTPYRRDPFVVSLSEKIGLLGRLSTVMAAEKGVRQAEATMDAFRERKVFASTAGSLIEQEIVECGAGIAAYAIGRGDMQVRSYPASFRGNFACAGYEHIEAMRLADHAPRVASEAAALLRAPACPAGEFDIILEGSQLALQIHESIGHAIELDRILGFEASFAGTSFIEPAMVGGLRYASPIVNVFSDSTVTGGLGTFAYDDEGVPAQRDPVIREGTLLGVLSSCSTAPRIGRVSNGTMRADGWSNFPLVRMTNVNLDPGEWELDALVADTKHGFLLETNKSWSIDDKRINFQFATETAREIRNGRLGKLYRNPVYTGATTRFWGSCDAICSASHWDMWGIPNCGKGEPVQTAHVGHGCAPARFRGVALRSE